MDKLIKNIKHYSLIQPAGRRKKVVCLLALFLPEIEVKSVESRAFQTTINFASGATVDNFPSPKLCRLPDGLTQEGLKGGDCLQNTRPASYNHPSGCFSSKTAQW